MKKLKAAIVWGPILLVYIGVFDITFYFKIIFLRVMVA